MFNMKKILIILFLIIFSNNIRAEDDVVQVKDWSILLDEAIQSKKYRTAAIIASKQNPAALIGRLRDWAEKNDTVTQWLYAKALYDEKRYEESAKWTFIAFFFTRYDASLCTNIRALNLEKPIVDSYSEIVDKSRSDREIINFAVSEAIVYLKAVSADSLSRRSPVWICELTDKIKNANLVKPQEEWRRIFDERLKQFVKSTTGKSDEVKVNDTNEEYSFGIKKK